MPRRRASFAKRAKRKAIRGMLLLTNIVLVAGVVVFISNSSETPSVKQAMARSSDSNTQALNPLDTVSSADIAVAVARVTNLPEKTSVTNHADSVNAQLTNAVTVSDVVAKPQIIAATSIKTKDDIVEYVVPAGEDMASIANKFGVTSESIRWSNNLAGNRLLAGKKLVIPPVNGFVYTVKAGDTPDKLAQKYNANKDLIVAFNDAELTGLKVGEKIVIPGGVVQAPAYVPPSYLSGYAFGSSAIYGYNGYDYGWCTWWAAKRRIDIGRPVPSNLGDAYTWLARARLAGLGTSSTPVAGAVLWENKAYPGHVAFVEEVLPDGSIWVSDMNASGQVSKTNPTPAGGWNRVSWRLIQPSQFGRYRFIH